MTEIQQTEKNNRQVAIWLMIGVGMIVIQVLLGGITRLTESGLSITEWKPITGTLPPLNENAWQVEFEKYRNTDQFKFVHQHFSMDDFKFIFFWEWFHRLWARLIGIVFLMGFFYFIVKKKFNKPMILPMVVLFLLGGIQGAIGWIMVSSGLVPEKYFVGHVELTTHFIAAMILLLYTLWFALSLLPAFQNRIDESKIRYLLWTILAVFFIQLIYGGFMAGLRAASTAPTWPTINGHWYPSQPDDLKLNVHFIHRSIAYLLLILSIVFYVQTRKIKGGSIFNTLRISFFVLILLQIILGISALLSSAEYKSVFIWVGVAHQFTAMLLLMILCGLIYLSKKPIKIAIVGRPSE